MSTDDSQRTSTPWPDWMLRFIASNDEGAFEDLIWSVGGSPPYGGVTYDEGQAVYDFLDGPDVASPEKYKVLKSLIEDNSERLATLEVYRVNNQITDAPESFTADSVKKGRALAEKLNHDGVRGLFLLYDSQLAHRNGDLEHARSRTVEGLTIFLRLADQDSAYALRAAQAAQNAISLTALSGDLETAHKLQEQLQPILDGFDFSQ